MKNSKSFNCFCLWTMLLPVWSMAGDSIPSGSFAAGLCFQKSVGFYGMNGITAEYSSERVLKHKIGFGFSFTSSGLGSAIATNAIPVYEVRISAVNKFRVNKKLQPYAGLSIGYTHANFGSDIFKDIPNSSPLLSVIAGAGFDFKFPLRIILGGGFNLITGNGVSGLGTIFPVYGQCMLLYRIPW